MAGLAKTILARSNLAKSRPRKAVPSRWQLTSDDDYRSQRLYANARIGADGFDASYRDNYGYERTTVIQQLPDLSVSVTGPEAPVAPGATVEYVVNYANAGAADTSGTNVTFNLPRGTSVGEDTGDWTCEDGRCTLEVGDLASGAEGSSSLTVTVDEDPSDRTSRLYGWVGISDNGEAGYDANRRDNYDSVQTRVAHQVPDLSVSLSDGDVDVTAGGTITYTLDYANNGLANASGVSLNLRVYGGSASVVVDGTEWSCENGRCNLELGDIAAGESGSLTIEVSLGEEFNSRRRSVFAFASIGDDGENGRDGNRRDNYSFERTRIVEAEEDGEDGDDDNEGGGDEPFVA